MIKIDSSKFFDYVSNLPAEAEFYFYSQSAGGALTDIKEKYQPADGNYFFDLFNFYTVKDFNFADLKIELKNQFNSSADEEIKLMAIDFIGMLFLPLSNFLRDKKIEQQFFALGGNGRNYRSYVDGFAGELEDKQLDLMEIIVESFDKKVNKNEEMKELDDLLANDLLTLLNDRDQERMAIINGEIMYFLSNFPDFKNRLVSDLIDNKEKIGEINISLSGDTAEPTVGKWLLDFISKKGSNYFDNVVLSDYLANSVNARQLNNDDKKVLAKILVLYRNLKFFPESMENLPPEKWGIIPIEISRESAETITPPVEMGDEAEFDESSLTPLELKALGEQKNKSDRI